MKPIKLMANARISTSKGSFSAGEVFEIEERYAKRLIAQGYAKPYEASKQPAAQIEPEAELGKLKANELKALAETMGLEAKGIKKADLIQKIVEAARESEAFAPILQMRADEISEQLGE